METRAVLLSHARYIRYLPPMAGVGLCFALIGPLAFGQEHPATLTAELAVIADGAETPEKIPDHLAYAHFIAAVSESESPSEEEFHRRAALLAPVHLAQRDTAALIAALRGVRNQLEFYDREVRRLSSERGMSAQRLDDLRVQRTRVFDEARKRLATALSAHGQLRLDTYIKTHFKRTIVIYGDRSE